MNGSGRDEMIERYLDGRLNRRELAEFLRRLDTDRELRRAVEVERAIRTTLLKDRAALPAEDRQSRAHLLSLLATLSPAAQQGALTSAQAVAGSQAASSTGVGSGLLGGALAKGVVAAVGTALAVATAIFVPQLFDAPESVRPTPVVERKVANGSPALLRSEKEPHPAPHDTVTAIVPEAVSSAPPPPPQPRMQEAAEKKPGVHENRVRETVADAAAIAPDRSSEAMPEQSISPPAPEPPPVISRDTMRVQVRIDLGKMKRGSR